MNAASLCSGIGGLDIAVQRAFGAEPKWFSESDPHCHAILNRHWPGIPIVPDVWEIDAGLGPVDLLHAGYPCQPFSEAGKQRGESDERNLWPAVARAIRLLRPRIVVLENVAAHLRLGFHTVLTDLAELGFDARWGVVRASDVGAPHQRARLFVVATDTSSAGAGRDGRSALASQESLRRQEPSHSDSPESARQALADANSGRFQERSQSNGGTNKQGLDASRRSHVDGRAAVEWGDYRPAIERWEGITGVAAPRPTNDDGRLMPNFVEWMMAFPIDWTEGLARTNRLRTLGNAVCPLQGELALRLLA